MNVDEFKAIYSPLFTDAWKFFRKWGTNPPEGKEWEQFSDELSNIQKKHGGCGRLSVDMLLDVTREVERLAGIRGREVKNDGRQV